jgi:hypothetical protein
LGDIITGDHPRHSMVAINHLHYSKKNQLNYSLYLSNIQIWYWEYETFAIYHKMSEPHGTEEPIAPLYTTAFVYAILIIIWIIVKKKRKENSKQISIIIIQHVLGKVCKNCTKEKNTNKLV